MIALSFVSASQVFAADGTVNFTGTIVGTACTVNGDSGSTAINVPMGTYSIASLASTGSQTPPQNFNINLTKCPNSGVKIRFDGTPVSGNSTLLALSPGQDAAKTIGIQITDLTSNVAYNISGQTDAVAFQTPTSGNISIPLAARYKAYQTGVVPSTANASIAFNLEYK